MVVGDWKGSTYGVNGCRHDLHLFLDHDGRFERTQTDQGQEWSDVGSWEYDEKDRVLKLNSDTPVAIDRMSTGWSVLSVTGCEDSNVMLVLRRIILGSRNLPMVLYRIHSNKRGYGSNWEQRLNQPAGQ